MKGKQAVSASYKLNNMHFIKIHRRSVSSNLRIDFYHARTQHGYAECDTDIAILSVRPSVCLSHAELYQNDRTD